jgi:hypothetical protein
MTLRKKYQDQDAALASPSQEAGPATETPIAVTEAPQPSAATEAGKAEIERRLAENERATTSAPSSPQQEPQYVDDPQQPLTPEEIIEQSGLPESAQRWLKKHPEYISDMSKNSEIIALHNTAKRQAGGEEWTPIYFEKMESLLGMRPEPEPQPQSHRQANRNQQVQPQQYRDAPTFTSAPPSRDVPSMSSGRPASYRSPLNADEREIALLSRRPVKAGGRMQTDEEAFAEYRHNKELARKRVEQERGYQ